MSTDTQRRTKPGIYSLTEDDYHSDPSESPSLSSSIAKLLCSSTPLHAWAAHPKLNPHFVREEKEIFDRGTVAHALMLQGLAVGHIIQATRWEGRGKERHDTGELVEDYKTAAAREERDAARLAGKVPILAHQWESVQAMVMAGKEQLAAHREAKNAFTAGKPEQTLIWEDDGGVICRARLDWLHDSYKFIDDYKSTGRDADPGTIINKVVDDWEIQEAFYRRGVKKLTGVGAHFRFIAQENTSPYALSVISLGPDIQWMGDKKVQYAIDLWARCLKTDTWPGYSDRICYPELPKWAEENWIGKELTI